MVFSTPSFPYKPSFSYKLPYPTNPRKWVADKLARLRERRAANEATMLKPIALAGASKGFAGRSQLCNSFARTQVHRSSPMKPESSKKKLSLDDTHSEADDEEPDDEDQAKRAVPDDDGQWKPCEMCSRRFLRRDSKFLAFCSLDCKSAAYLGVGAYAY